MPKQKKPRKKAYNPEKFRSKTPLIMTRLPPSDAYLHRFETESKEALFRCYFRTASLDDLNMLFTRLSLSVSLSENMVDADALKKEFEDGKVILRKGARERTFEREDLDRLCGIIDLMIDLWRQSTIEEIKKLEQVVDTPEFMEDQLLPDDPVIDDKLMQPVESAKERPS